MGEGEEPVVLSWILIGCMLFISPRRDNIYQFDLSTLLQSNKTVGYNVTCNESSSFFLQCMIFACSAGFILKSFFFKLFQG